MCNIVRKLVPFECNSHGVRSLSAIAKDVLKGLVVFRERLYRWWTNNLLIPVESLLVGVHAKGVVTHIKPYQVQDIPRLVKVWVCSVSQRHSFVQRNISHSCYRTGEWDALLTSVSYPRLNPRSFVKSELVRCAHF